VGGLTNEIGGELDAHGLAMANLAKCGQGRDVQSSQELVLGTAKVVTEAIKGEDALRIGGDGWGSGTYRLAVAQSQIDDGTSRSVRKFVRATTTCPRSQFSPFTPGAGATRLAGWSTPTVAARMSSWVAVKSSASAVASIPVWPASGRSWFIGALLDRSAVYMERTCAPLPRGPARRLGA
jgi:hypothetical protein